MKHLINRIICRIKGHKWKYDASFADVIHGKVAHYYHCERCDVNEWGHTSHCLKVTKL